LSEEDESSPELTIEKTRGPFDIMQTDHAESTAQRRPISVSRLAGPLGITLAAVVQPLQILEESGLVHTEKRGRVRTCSIQPEALSAEERWIGERRSVWGRRFDGLGELLAESDED
jgi:DNA-binding transcriptional ArsR family regulator